MVKIVFLYNIISIFYEMSEFHKAFIEQSEISYELNKNSKMSASELLNFL
jgi:hypothetical protein